ncbi:hypothetical protein WOLCODRAFT_137707 [Wolfiporia cocos MD-104 SS10]|uniref:Uncharacterized protein n=1 Tax=Wolfiporia cocos (strain MD-104) TaxID=742152 RepID=A0A2H3JZE7_WOLCO|nr:hypothetical protein WOLCODRAFT_137707 [Wolfiporia cocos MD-104 SS10]
MATPSSSTTTPSPQLRYIQPNTPTAPSTPAQNENEADEKEDKDKAVQRFLARAEVGKLTFGLRTRLSYASFKAMHNLSHNTLGDLEHDSEQARNPNRPGNYYNNPATQGNSAMTPSGSGRGRKGQMAPPPPVTASATQSLFSSLLAPPPAKRARTIHNPDDPPVPAPVKPRGTPPVPRKSGKSSRGGDTTHPRHRSRKGRDRDNAKGKGRQAVHDPEEGAADVDIDMRAAATLTSFLMSSRPSISASASSPRSSASAGSDSGSTHGYHHFVQSSTRTNDSSLAMPSYPAYNAPQPRPITPQQPPVGDSSSQPVHRHSSSGRIEARASPRVRHTASQDAGDTATPHPPSDAEAANSLLFLATSPSPMRAAAAKDGKQASLLRTWSGNSSLSGRVLFPGQGSATEDGSSASGRSLRRDDSGSFMSTGTSTSSGYAGGSFAIYNKQAAQANTSDPGHQPAPVQSRAAPGTVDNRPPSTPVPREFMVTPPTPTNTTQSKLLPSPPLRKGADHLVAVSRASSVDHSIPIAPMSAMHVSDRRPGDVPHMTTPGNTSFSFSEYIHSPSPANVAGPSSRLGATHPDVGRRLFEEHHGSSGPNSNLGVGAGSSISAITGAGTGTGASAGDANGGLGAGNNPRDS